MLVPKLPVGTYEQRSNEMQLITQPWLRHTD